MDIRIKHVLDFVLKNLNKKISIVEACRIAALSPSRFCELFKKETGLCFSKFVVEERIKKACELLRDKSLSIKQISYEVGYRHISNFNHDFRRLVGIPPSYFRKKLNGPKQFRFLLKKFKIFTGLVVKYTNKIVRKTN